MNVVLLFFCAILITLITICLIIMLSSIKLNIKRCYISNIKGNLKIKGIDKEILIYIDIYLFGLIKIAKIKLTKKLLKRLKVESEIKSIEKDVKKIKKIHLLETIKKLKIKLEKLDVNLLIGTESMMITVYLVAIISTIIGTILAKTNPKTEEFSVMPLYNFGNSIKFNLNCIISVKVVHIIYVIYILLKVRRSKNERTSNRRSYDYSYE